ncbi:MAG: polysaccharide lyase family 7 protein [Cyclobacteriaceae bacterium]
MTVFHENGSTTHIIHNKLMSILLVVFLMVLSCCGTSTNSLKEASVKEDSLQYPSDIISSIGEWSILLGNGESQKQLKSFQHTDYYFTANDSIDWVVFKTPNGGVTSPNSHNTRTELGQKKRWTAKEGGKLSATLKVMHVSTSGDARVAASYSVVVGQIHSDTGHENEPLKIFYKKFPGHRKGSLFWNYEINTEGDNSGRWDYSTAVWGYDMSIIGTDANDYPEEPKEGIALGEEFSYEVNVFDGIMYLTFESPNHETKKYTKSLIMSEFNSKSDIPSQIVNLYSIIGRDGTERANAYEGEEQFFKLGNYNQSNGREPETNMVWSTGAETYGGNLTQQYSNGSYTEVWFREASVGEGIEP